MDNNTTTVKLRRIKVITIAGRVNIEIFRNDRRTAMEKSESFTNTVNQKFNIDLAEPKPILKSYLVSKDQVIPLDSYSDVDYLVKDEDFRLLCGTKELREVILKNLGENFINLSHSSKIRYEGAYAIAEIDNNFKPLIVTDELMFR